MIWICMCNSDFISFIFSIDHKVHPALVPDKKYTFVLDLVNKQIHGRQKVNMDGYGERQMGKEDGMVDGHQEIGMG